MKDYKDSLAYKLYLEAQENVETKKAVEELYETILKVIIRMTDFGNTFIHYKASEYRSDVLDKVVLELIKTGFKVHQGGDDHDKLFILWDFSEEDASEINVTG